MNAVHVNYITEEEKLASFERKLEIERKAKRRIDWYSVEQKALGLALLIFGIFASIIFSKIDKGVIIFAIIGIVFGLPAILCSGSIFTKNYEWEEV